MTISFFYLEVLFEVNFVYFTYSSVPCVLITFIIVQFQNYFFQGFLLLCLLLFSPLLFITVFYTFYSVNLIPLNNHKLIVRNRNTLEQSVRRGQNQQEAHENDIKELPLVSLVAELSKFHSLLRQTHCRWNKY